MAARHETVAGTVLFISAEFFSFNKYKCARRGQRIMEEVDGMFEGWCYEIPLDPSQLLWGRFNRNDSEKLDLEREY